MRAYTKTSVNDCNATVKAQSEMFTDVLYMLTTWNIMDLIEEVENISKNNIKE